MAKANSRKLDKLAVSITGRNGQTTEMSAREAILQTRSSLYSGGAATAKFFIDQLDQQLPDSPAGLLLLKADYYSHLGENETAYQLIQEALEQEKSSSAYHQLARTLLNLGENKKALDAVKNAINIEGKNAQFFVTAARVYKESGKPGKALPLLEKAIDLNPLQFNAYTEKSLLPGQTLSAQDIENCRNILSNDQVKPNSKAHVYFSLARHFEATANIDEQMQMLHHGNALKHQLLGASSRVPGYQSATKIAEAFTRERIADLLPADNEQGSNFLFILGFPRSGSTLTEHILSSHPDTSSAGESLALTNAMIELGLANYPQWLSTGTQKETVKIKSKMLEKLAPYRSAPFTIEKSLNNLFYIGLLKILFPQAKFIHTYKNAVDCCLGCYKQLFEGDAWGYIYNLETLRRGYENYHAMMKYWEDVFPGSILHFRYEDLIENQEQSTRMLLDYCGLGWDDSCLDFTGNRKNVSTASSLQVREPLNSKAIGRWKKYRDHLEELLPLLDLPDWPPHSSHPHPATGS